MTDPQLIQRRRYAAEAMGRMSDQVQRLSATANYMGYDGLTEIYDQMQAGLEAFGAQSENADAAKVDAFLQATVVGTVDRIQELFPNADSLAAIDTMVLTVMPSLKRWRA